MKGYNVFIWTLILLLGVQSANAFIISDRAINVKDSGVTIVTGNLSVYLYDAMSGGTLLTNENFTNAIVNGSWTIYLGKNSYLNLTYGEPYFFDYQVNGNDVNFTNSTGFSVPRKEWYAPAGYVGVSNLTGTLDNKVQSDAANITSGTLAQARIPDQSNLHTHDAANVTTGVFALARIPEINNSHTHDAANITAGTLGAARGGTGVTTTTDDNVLVASGSAWVSALLPDCSNGVNSKVLYNISNNTFLCGTDQGGSTTFLPATNISSGLFGSSIGNNSFNFTGLAIVSNLSLLGNANISGFDNKVQSDAANVTTGVFALARIPQINDSHTHGAPNITAGLFGAGVGNFIFNNILTINGTINLTPTTVVTGFNNNIQIDAANTTAGVFALARIPQINDTHTHDAANITSGTLGAARGGTGVTTTTDDNVLVASGSAWVSALLPDCSNGVNSKVLYNISNNTFLCGTDQTGGGGASTIPAGNISSGLFGSSIGNNSFNITSLNVLSNLTVDANISFPINSVLDSFINTLASDKLFNISFFNNKIQSNAANVTAGVFALARIPEINNSHTHDALNLTSGTIPSARYDTTFVVNKNATGFLANTTVYCANISGATSNLCTVAGGGSALNISNDTTLVVQNPTGLNFSNSDFTVSVFGTVARFVLNTVAIANINTTFVAHKNGTASIANSTLPCSNITGATSNLCTITGGGPTRTFVRLLKDNVTLNNTFWIRSDLMLPVSAGLNYTYECNILGYTAAATTGLQFNVTSPGSPTFFTTQFTTAVLTSGNGPAWYGGCASTVDSCAILPTAGVVTPGVPTKIAGRLVNGANAGNITIWYKSEITVSSVNLTRESYCYMYNEP